MANDVKIQFWKNWKYLGKKVKILETAQNMFYSELNYSESIQIFIKKYFLDHLKS